MLIVRVHESSVGKIALTLLALFGEDVTLVRMLTLNASATCQEKTLLSA